MSAVVKISKLNQCTIEQYIRCCFLLVGVLQRQRQSHGDGTLESTFIMYIA